jgi:phage terminase small subunit
LRKEIGQKDKQWSTEYHKENKRFNNNIPTETVVNSDNKRVMRNRKSKNHGENNGEITTNNVDKTRPRKQKIQQHAPNNKIMPFVKKLTYIIIIF